MQQLCAHSWKGNIRELENVVERAIILCTGERIELEHLPGSLQAEALSTNEVPTGAGAESLRAAARDAERQRIVHVLSEQRDKRAAAKLLGISLSSLYRKIEELGIGARHAHEVSSAP